MKFCRLDKAFGRIPKEDLGQCLQMNADAVLRRIFNAGDDDRPIIPNLTSFEVDLSEFVYPISHPLVVRFAQVDNNNR